MANIFSTIILGFFFWGRSLRFRNLKAHVFVMCAVILADLSLVMVLIWKERALDRVTFGMPWTLKVHIPIALVTIGLYFVIAWTGFRLYRVRLQASGRQLALRRRMRRLDRILVPARVFTLVTSLMVQLLSK